MIDDKKIDEAARTYCQETKYNREEVLLIEEGFYKGARWAINEFLKDLWHPASEEPKTGKRILIKYRLDVVEYKDIIFLGIVSWNSLVKSEGIIYWLYLDDLLKGDEQ